MRNRLQARPQPSNDKHDVVDEELFSGLPEITELPPPQAVETGPPNQESVPEVAGTAESSLTELAVSPLELLRSGVPAGFSCILSTMVLFGLLGLPGSLGAASGGYFGGRLAGDPARAVTSAEAAAARTRMFGSRRASISASRMRSWVGSSARRATPPRAVAAWARAR